MEREQLWKSYQLNKDLLIRDNIIESYLPLVKKIVGRMTLKLPLHWDREDVISYGIIGLIEAVERFIPAKGIKFETFATLRIRGAILDALRDSTIIPRGLSENLSKVSRTIERLEQEMGTETTSEDIAKVLNMSVKEVDGIIMAFAHLSCVSLQESLRIDGTEGEGLALIDTLAAPSMYNPEEQVAWKETQDKLIKAIDELTEKEKLVLAMYFHEQLTLKEIAYIMNITESRVSQLKSKILLKIRLFLEKGK
ncbi:MAG: hypothetical protein APF76_05670 [Desulfitibacter sp. BRH_c19]|nr:MAG: hypothetical protein APF76_05670 [Desulfitibacter sp. BRH_c19]